MARNDLQVLQTVVDELGLLLADKAVLVKREEELKSILRGAGVSPVEGQLFRATVATPAPTEVVDWKAIAERLEPSRQLITAHTTWRENAPRVSVKARTGE